MTIYHFKENAIDDAPGDDELPEVVEATFDDGIAKPCSNATKEKERN